MTFPANDLEVALQRAFDQQVPVATFVAALLQDVVCAPGLVIGLDLDPDQPATRELALRAVRDVAAEGGAPIDVVLSADRDSFTRWMSANAAPFHRGSTQAR